MDSTFDVKLTEQQINKISKDSKVKVELPSGNIYVLRPINAGEYYEYRRIEDEDEEMEAKAFAIASSVVEPEMTVDEVKEQPIGEFKLLFMYAMKISFLTPMDLNG